jgi:allantoin racemase
MRIKIIYAVARDFSPLTPEQISGMKGEWEGLASPGTEIGVSRVRFGSETIECNYDCEMSSPYVLEEVCQAQEEGFDGVIIGCAGDPGLYGARELADIPVVGVGETSMLLATGLGRRFSIIVPEKILEGLMLANVSKYDLRAHLVSIRCFSKDMTIQQIRDSIELDHREDLRAAVTEAGRDAVEDGAGALVLGCATLAEIADQASLDLGVPVIHSRRAAVAYTECLIRMGLSHSKRTFPTPPKKQRLLR